MSIFEAKDFWTTKVGTSEEFDSNSITIGNLDNESVPRNKIAVSSFQGFLRIYEPKFGEFKIEHLLYEKCYNESILQISHGRCIINSNDFQLIVLHNKKLVIYQFYNLRGVSSCKICFDHKLSRNAFNFCLGKVGDRKYDNIFVQSVDGVITIIEQDSIVNNIELYDMILPGSIEFMEQKDCFLISNIAYDVECYSYNTLATGKSKTGDNKLYANWKVNIGEITKDIKLLTNNITKKQDIIILGETIIHILNDNGVLMYQKKLDYECFAIYPYNIEDLTNYQVNKQFNGMLMASTHQNHILVYKGPKLSWAAKVNETPIFIYVSEFEGVKGIIISLSDNGYLTLNYLGMQQVKNDKMILPTKNYNPDKIYNETIKLQSIIDNYDKGIVAFPKEFLDIKVEVGSDVILDDNNDNETIYSTDRSGKIKRIQAKIDLIFEGKMANNVKLHILTPYNIVCDEPFINVGIVKKEESYSKVVNFRVIESFYPTNLRVKTYTTYEIKGARNISDKGTKSTSIAFYIPLNLILRANPAKNTNLQYKLILTTDRDKSVEINQLFNELTTNFVDEDIVRSSNLSISFNLPNNTEVQIIGSNKNTGKYKVQSNQYEGLVFMTNILCTKLQEVYENNINFSIENELEIDRYIEIISKHHNLYIELKNKKTELEEYSSLYTLVQKSIINKYKEKTPPNLKYLDFMLNHAHNLMIELAEDINNFTKQYKLTFKDVIIWTETMVLMLKLKAKLTDEKYEIIRDVFPLDNLESLTDYSWTDITLTNMNNFIKFYFLQDDDLKEVKEVKTLEKWRSAFKELTKTIIKKEGF